MTFMRSGTDFYQEQVKQLAERDLEILRDYCFTTFTGSDCFLKGLFTHISRPDFLNFADFFE
jgi:hypothetical protein